LCALIPFDILLDEKCLQVVTQFVGLGTYGGSGYSYVGGTWVGRLGYTHVGGVTATCRGTCMGTDRELGVQLRGGGGGVYKR
jgi:hypothetical protein